jgi:FKBP-type peptidyl-prolyl cis-trans isomerase
MRPKLILLSLLAMGAFLHGQSKKATTGAASNKSAPAKSASKVHEGPTKVSGKPVTTPSGLQYWDIKKGKGATAVAGKLVSVQYTGWLADGKEFDSSLDLGDPIDFTLGKGNVIKGWDEGVAGMKIGGKRQLRIPPELGYGPRGAPPSIPPNAILVFDVELVAVK